MLSSSSPQRQMANAASSSGEIVRTLASLKSFFETHAFDTEGPYTDIFAVLLSTCKHLIDTNAAQQTRISALEGHVRQVQGETAILCEQSAKTSVTIHALCEELADAQRRIRSLASADSERFLNTAVHSTVNGGSSNAAGVPADEADFRHFARSVGRRLHVLEAAEKDAVARAEWAAGQLSRLEANLSGTQKQVDKVLVKLQRQQLQQESLAPTPARQQSTCFPFRPLEALSEVAEMECENRYKILQQRLSLCEDAFASLDERFKRTTAAVETAKAASTEEQYSTRRVVARVQEHMNELSTALGKLQQQRQQTSPARPSQITVLGSSTAPPPLPSPPAVAFSEDDFRAPYPTGRIAHDCEGGNGAHPRSPHATVVAEVENAIWRDLAALLQSIRKNECYPAATLSAAPPPAAVAALAQEFRALLRDGPVGQQGTQEKESVAATAHALADKLDTLSGRVEVLEVYAPHTYAIATRPPLLGLELADHPIGEKGSGSGGVLSVKTVFAGFIADEAGISPGDVILSVDGAVVTSRAEMYVVLREKTRAHQVRCQLLLEKALTAQVEEVEMLSDTDVATHPITCEEVTTARVQKRLPSMELSLVVKRREEAREVVLRFPSSTCWPRPSW